MTVLRSIRPSRAAADGFILIAVLWILAAMATLVSVYSVYISNTAMAAAVRNDDLVARSLVSAGVELAAYRILSAPKERRPMHGEVTFRMGQARIVAAFRNETARIDLNAAPKELLAGLFAALGAKAEEAEPYAERVAAWRSPASQDDEEAIYREAGLTYGPRGTPFAHVDEIWLVAGLPSALVERALPYLTVFSGKAEILEREADPVVLASLPDSSPDRLAAQSSPTGASTGGGRAAASPGTTAEGGDSVRVTVRIDFDNGQVRAAEAVILIRDFGDDPYRVLSWRDDIQMPERRMHTEAVR